MTRTKLIASAALFANTLIWASTFTIVKSALSGISPMVLVSSRFLLASLVMMPFFIAPVRQANAKQFRQASILGFILFIGFITQTVGLMTTTATKSAFITGTFIIFTPIFQTILERRIPSKANIAAIASAIIGVLFLAGNGSSLSGFFSEIGRNITFGDFLTLICAISYALYIVYIDLISESMDYKFLTFWQIFVTAVLSLLSIPVMHLSGIEPARFTPSPLVIGAILYTALFATTLTTAVQTKFQRAVSPTRASLIFSMEMVFAAVFAFLILSERISLFGYIGSGLIISGVLISELFSKD